METHLASCQTSISWLSLEERYLWKKTRPKNHFFRVIKGCNEAENLTSLKGVPYLKPVLNLHEKFQLPSSMRRRNFFELNFPYVTPS